jgi:hypothetical protein
MPEFSQLACVSRKEEWGIIAISQYRNIAIEAFISCGAEFKVNCQNSALENFANSAESIALTNGGFRQSMRDS